MLDHICIFQHFLTVHRLIQTPVILTLRPLRLQAPWLRLEPPPSSRTFPIRKAQGSGTSTGVVNSTSVWTIIRHTTARFVLDQKCFQTNLVSISDKEQRTSASLKSETTVPKGSEVSVRCVLKLSFSLIGSGAGKTHTHIIYLLHQSFKMSTIFS